MATPNTTGRAPARVVTAQCPYCKEPFTSLVSARKKFCGKPCAVAYHTRPKQALTVERLHEVLDYDPATGIFRWKQRLARRVRSTGVVAGTLCKALGYIKIGIDGKQRHAHRIAWFYVHGVWPDGEIDHINGVRNDNRLANLRDVPKAVNRQNIRRPQADNTSGYLGVTKCGNRFLAQLKVNYKHIRIGTFDTAEQAYAAYVAAKREGHEGCTL